MDAHIENETKKVRIEKAVPRKMTRAELKAERKEKRRWDNIENQKLLLRDRFARELELTKRSQKLSLDGWEELCGQIKIDELRKELVAWGEQNKRLMDKKNYKIEMLLQDIEATEDMLRRGQGQTKEIAGFVRDTFENLLKITENLYDFQVEEMSKNFTEEMKQCTLDADFMKETAENTTHCFNETATETMREDYEIFLKKRDDIFNDNIQKRSDLRDNVVAQMQEMHKRLLAFIEELRGPNWEELSTTDMKTLSKNNKAFVAEMKILTQQEWKYRKIISKLERRLLEEETKTNAQMNDLKLELEYFRNVRQKYVDNFNEHCNLSDNMVKKLCVHCYAIKQDYDKFVKTGESLLALAKDCRKLHSNVDMGQPSCPIPSLNFALGAKDTKFKIDTLDLKKHFDMTEEDIIEQNQFLSNFLRHMSTVEAQNMLLVEKKRKLMEKRDKIKNFIKSKMSVANANAQSLNDSLHVTPVGPQSWTCPYKLESRQK